MAVNIRALCCAYCGDRATCRDHVIPLAYFAPNRRKANRQRKSDWTVPSCHECNALLGAQPLFTVPERAAYLSNRYQRRWKKLLNTPVWTDNELSELEGNFHRRIESIEMLRDHCLSRLSHLAAIVLLDEDYLHP